LLLVGKVTGRPSGDAHAAAGLHFVLRNVKGHPAARVPVSYTGSVPDLFRSGREVVRRRDAPRRHVRREAGHALDQVPVEVRAAKTNAKT